MKILRNKLLILLLLSATPLFSKEAYFQQNEQMGIISILGKVSKNTMWNTDNKYQGIEGIGGLNLEAYGRWTEPNFFGTFKVKGIFPFSKNNKLVSFDYMIYIGMGGFLFDKRNELGIGSFMTMSFNGFFYPFTKDIGMGVSLDTRYYYAFHKISSLAIGVDLSYRVSNIDNITGLHIFSVGLNFGFSFNAYK